MFPLQRQCKRFNNILIKKNQEKQPKNKQSHNVDMSYPVVIKMVKVKTVQQPKHVCDTVRKHRTQNYL